MKNHFSKKWLITFSIFSIVAIAISIALACGGDDWYVLQSSSFSPEASIDKGYTPFFYDPYNHFHEIGFDSEHTTRFSENVIDDWYGFLDGKIAQENIDLLLLSDESTNEVEKLYDYFTKRSASDVVQKWSTLADLNDWRVRAFVEFTQIAKQIDKFAAPVRDEDLYWNYKSARTNGEGVPRSIINELAERYNKASDPFLKNRYWFQNIKALFYANLQQEFEAFFETTKQQEPQNILYYRALGYLAAFEYEQKNYKEANIIYANIFDKTPEMRTVATNSFHLESEDDWMENIAMAKTTEERVALWTILGYLKDEERAIGEIYTLNPKSKQIDLLLTRVINKHEVNAENGLFATDVASNKLVDEQLLKMITKIAADNKISNPYLWHSAIGYIYTWEGKYNIANNYFNEAEKALPNAKQLASHQLRLLRLLNEIKAIKTIEGNNIEKLTSELAWLYNMKEHAPENLRYEHAIRESKEYFATLYAKQNNLLYSELLKHESAFYMSPQNIDNILRFMLKQNKSPFEQLLNQIYPLSIYDLYHYKAVEAAFDDNLEDAINYMKNAGHLGERELLANPFNGFIKDCHDCEHARRQTVKYSSLSALLKMKKMKDYVKQNKDVYNNSLLLGNAYYNLTFYGNARLFSVSGLTGEIIPGLPENIACFAQTMLTNCNTANKHYQKAVIAAENDEQRAKATYMIAKCERNEYYNKHYTFGKCGDYSEYFYNPDGFNAKSFSYAWNGFKDLKEKYANTQYYKDVIEECEYFEVYVDSE
ncbi:MAG: hypothetical protein PHH10_08690 [Dysgonamonadaceae bacterium]|nr:hypothetical protein [Dysgonamonadaceae bacterium]